MLPFNKSYFCTKQACGAANVSIYEGLMYYNACYYQAVLNKLKIVISSTQFPEHLRLLLRREGRPDPDPAEEVRAEDGQPHVLVARRPVHRPRGPAVAERRPRVHRHRRLHDDEHRRALHVLGHLVGPDGPLRDDRRVEVDAQGRQRLLDLDLPGMEQDIY